jgi:hypothetical protein
MNTTIEYILSQNDLVAMANQAGTQMVKRYSDWRGTCPIHIGTDKNEFSIYEENGKQYYKCFSGGCGSGDVIDFYMAWRKVDLKTAINYFMGDKKPDPATMTNVAVERAERAEKKLKETIATAQAALKDLQEARAWEGYHKQLEENEEARTLWEKRGIPIVWQDIWMLGYCNAFRVSTSEGMLTTPSLTMPIFGPDWELLNIRHRLLNPLNPKDKYRPERVGLSSQAFMTDPDLGMKADNVLVVEGEIKSMVTYIALDSPKWQVLGIPGKTWFHKIIDKLQGKRVIICFDPDAKEEAKIAAQSVNGRIINLAMKIDDAIMAGYLDKSHLRHLLTMAGKVN